MKSSDLDKIQPLSNYVLVENPLNKEMLKEHEDKLKLLPPEEQEIYKKSIRSPFEKIKVLKVGDGCVDGIIEGCSVVSSPELLRHATSIFKNEALLIRDVQIIAINNNK